jgi:tripartite-type tricarboxylate transporter receptor subunit TctC
VGNAPGGGIDITARAIAMKLGELWGRTIVVDNRAGGAGLIAIDLASQASPDGYTLLVTSGSLIGSATAQKKLPYDTRTRLTGVNQLTTLCYMLMVNPSVPAKSVRELVAFGKNKPGALHYGSSGIGGAGHLAGELFASMADIKLVHVPYKGGGQVLIDMISGQVQMGFTATISALPHVRSGKLRALGVTCPQLVNWYGIFAPAKTSQPIINALHQGTSLALKTPEVQAMFAKDGADPTPASDPAEFHRVFEREVVMWEKIIKMPAFAQGL